MPRKSGANPIPELNIRIANHNQTIARPRPQIVVGFDHGLATNHNQTVARPEVGINPNHNQTVVRPRPQIVVGFDPGLSYNHNQTLVRR